MDPIQARRVDESRIRAPASKFQPAVLRLFASGSKPRSWWIKILSGLLRLPRPNRRQTFLRRHALSQLQWLPRILIDIRNSDLNKLPRTLRGDHRPDSRGGLVRRRQRGNRG